ncbi:cytochrome b5-like heme/steroid binding domain-containing protein [Ilyonectria robusta]|uniref:cytochrome b5-like heme/steroid binding domain-containing protein n=1 Tax=Ilyonectria robusta TaxID=1079257 RepID=UPI001E8DB68C|nr:cytochrome b5-like heme/steroid binding domain-containing protein [Ilyonectria robusta]KAH6985975.1 cytochrome b5-like heme/steroid binding domain-containing protein [Ilyonectria sp. MPI-CAGE-AT-0026]KAH8699637.1 cytochrome b5-like heme/steroid binding domain-containing protein [Ilyonectria robusta]
MSGKFEPKVAVTLAPPKDDLISAEELAKANGADGGKCYVAIKGKVYDVSGNKAYLPGASYNVFAGKDASRALGMTSTKPEDALPDWQDLSDKEKGVLNDWVTFFSKRYNVVGHVEGATNME